MLGTFLFVHGLHAGFQVAKVAGPRNHWPGQARPGQCFYHSLFRYFQLFQQTLLKKQNETKNNNSLYRDTIHKKLNINALNQTVNLTIGTCIVHSLCSLLQYEWNTIKMQLMQLIINTSYGSNVMTVQFLTFSSVAEEAGCCRGVILAVGDAV